MRNHKDVPKYIRVYRWPCVFYKTVAMCGYLIGFVWLPAATDFRVMLHTTFVHTSNYLCHWKFISKVLLIHDHLIVVFNLWQIKISDNHNWDEPERASH